MTKRLDLTDRDIVSIATDQFERLVAMGLFVPPVLLAEIGTAFQMAGTIDRGGGGGRETVRTDADDRSRQPNRLALIVRIEQESARQLFWPINAVLPKSRIGDRLHPDSARLFRCKWPASEHQADRHPSEDDDPGS